MDPSLNPEHSDLGSHLGQSEGVNPTDEIEFSLCHFIIAVIFARNEDKWAEQPAAGWAAVSMVWVRIASFAWSLSFITNKNVVVRHTFRLFLGGKCSIQPCTIGLKLTRNYVALRLDSHRRDLAS